MTSSVGETSLSTLLASLTTTLHTDIFVFVTIPYDDPSHPSISLPLPVYPIEAAVREPEGLTLITTADAAQKRDLASIYRCRKITLNVHSSLEAIGFLAAITAKLKDAEISCNPVSGYYHDHLFVPEDRAEEAVRILGELAGEARKKTRPNVTDLDD